MINTKLNDSLNFIRKANCRDIGETCFREVCLSLGKLGKSTSKPDRNFQIRTLRYTQGVDSYTFFCIISPRIFSGISFLLHEVRGCMLPFDINLYLPYGLHIIRHIEHSRRGEGLLGSDFSYNDLKTWVYEEKQDTILIGKKPYKGFDCMVIESILDENIHPSSIIWKKQHIWIDIHSFVIHQIEFFQEEDSRPYRRLSINNYHLNDNILIPDRMLIENYNTNHETTIELIKAWHNHHIDPKIFTSNNLKKCRDILSSL